MLQGRASRLRLSAKRPRLNLGGASYTEAPHRIEIPEFPLKLSPCGLRAAKGFACSNQELTGFGLGEM